MQNDMHYKINFWRIGILFIYSHKIYIKLEGSSWTELQIGCAPTVSPRKKLRTWNISKSRDAMIVTDRCKRLIRHKPLRSRTTTFLTGDGLMSGWADVSSSIIVSHVLRFWYDLSSYEFTTASWTAILGPDMLCNCEFRMFRPYDWLPCMTVSSV